MEQLTVVQLLAACFLYYWGALRMILTPRHDAEAMIRRVMEG